MLISELQSQLEICKKEYGDIPVVMAGIKDNQVESLTIEEIKAIPFPPGAKQGQTQFYVAALLNEEIYREPYDY